MFTDDVVNELIAADQAARALQQHSSADSSKSDYIEGSLMLAYNDRVVG